MEIPSVHELKQESEQDKQKEMLLKERLEKENNIKLAKKKANDKKQDEQTMKRCKSLLLREIKEAMKQDRNEVFICTSKKSTISTNYIFNDLKHEMLLEFMSQFNESKYKTSLIRFNQNSFDMRVYWE